MAALRRANQVRVARSSFKRWVASGVTTVSVWIDSPPTVLETMPVVDLLREIPHTGVIKSGYMLRRCGIPAQKTVGALSPRQREALLQELASR